MINNIKTKFFEYEKTLTFESDIPVVLRRNINTTTIAPTGTTSILGQTRKNGDVGSGGEPFFSLSYKRNVTNLDNTKTEQIYKNKLFL
jgi:ribonucleotide reductase alpha subunit